MRATHILSACFLAQTLFLAPGRAGADDSCVDCHKNTDFMVTNKKLYDYFQRWQNSAHGQEDVTCSDCHGGNPQSSAKAAAHKSMTGLPGRSITFKRVPKICGDCHDDLYNAYVTSKHYQHLDKKKQVEQGPNCVTCHGSVSAKALDVTSVRATCANCHNAKTKNHPNIPQKAEALLNSLNSIRAFYRYIGIRGHNESAAESLRILEPKIDALAVTWHTFDLEKIEPDTKVLLEYAKEKRREIKGQRTPAGGEKPTQPAQP